MSSFLHSIIPHYPVVPTPIGVVVLGQHSQWRNVLRVACPLLPFLSCSCLLHCSVLLLALSFCVFIAFLFPLSVSFFLFFFLLFVYDVYQCHLLPSVGRSVGNRPESGQQNFYHMMTNITSSAGCDLQRFVVSLLPLVKLILMFRRPRLQTPGPTLAIQGWPLDTFWLMKCLLLLFTST